MSEKDSKDKDEKKKATSVRLERRQPTDLARRFIESLSMDERREVMHQLMNEFVVKKGWRHPINIVVTGCYHQCAACGGKIGDEVIVVVRRRRSGDQNFVFCGVGCLSNYDDW